MSATDHAPSPHAAPWLRADGLRSLGGPAPTWGSLIVREENQPPVAEPAASAAVLAERIRAGDPGGPWFAFAPGDTHLRTVYEIDEVADAVLARGRADAAAALRTAWPRALLVLALVAAGVMFWPADRGVQMTLLLVVIFFVVPLWRQGVEAAFAAWFALRRIERQPDAWRRSQDRQMRFSAYSQRQASLAAYLLVGAFVLVYLAALTTGPGSLLAPVSRVAVERWGLWAPAVRAGEWWRLLSCAFLHANVVHIYFNSMAGLSLALVARSLVNETRILAVFLISALVGSAASCVVDLGVPSVGASGGILGWGGLLMGMALTHPDLRGTGLITMMLRWVVLIALIGVVGTGFIDNAAHAGGFVAGLLCGVFLARFQGRTLPIGAAGRSVSFYVLAALTLGGAAWMAVDLLRIG